MVLITKHVIAKNNKSIPLKIITNVIKETLNGCFCPIISCKKVEYRRNIYHII